MSQFIQIRFLGCLFVVDLRCFGHVWREASSVQVELLNLIFFSFLQQLLSFELEKKNKNKKKYFHCLCKKNSWISLIPFNEKPKRCSCQVTPLPRSLRSNLRTVPWYLVLSEHRMWCFLRANVTTNQISLEWKSGSLGIHSQRSRSVRVWSRGRTQTISRSSRWRSKQSSTQGLDCLSL